MFIESRHIAHIWSMSCFPAVPARVLLYLRKKRIPAFSYELALTIYKIRLMRYFINRKDKK